MNSVGASPPDATPPPRPAMQSLLAQLLEAHESARAAKRPVEEFAVSLARLILGGGSGPALESLVSAGHVRQLPQQPSGPADNALFPQQPLFVLTESGVNLARAQASATPPPVMKCSLDASRRELWLDVPLPKRPPDTPPPPAPPDTGEDE